MYKALQDDEQRRVRRDRSVRIDSESEALAKVPDVSRYVMIRLTVAQAQAASNACDLIRDQLEADGNKRDAALYERASVALSVRIDSESEALDE